jgi:GDP-L-fucose synthase
MNNADQISKDSRILVTGGTGLVGRALVRELGEQGFRNVTSIGSKDCDLRDGVAVKSMMAEVRPEYVFHMAARVHGLGGNAKYKSDILVDNVLINTNVIEQARIIGVKKMVAMGSGCVYPELKGQQELFEDQVWLGPPHSSEDSYAHSKRLMLAQLNAANAQYGLPFAFVISGNLYGPHDNFNTEDGHVIPSLIAKFHAAKESGVSVKVWGSGVAIRDFTFANDMARALITILYQVDGAVNTGSGQRHPIKDIVNALQSHTSVPVEWDATKPDGQLVRYYNLDKLTKAGFQAQANLKDGVVSTYNWYVDNLTTVRR